MPGRYLKKYANKNNYQLKFKSFLLDDKNENNRKYIGPGGDFYIYLYSIIDRILALIELSFVADKNANIEMISKNNMEAIKQSFKKTEKQLGIYHFLTYHHSIPEEDNEMLFKKNLSYADTIGIKAIEMIIKKKPKAKIIVLSDHGQRYYSQILKKDYCQGILYVKN